MSFNRTYDETVSIGDWIGSMLLMCIPVVNIVLMLVWAFGSGTKPSKRNFFRASLLLMVIGIGLSVIAGIVISLLGGMAMFSVPEFPSFLG